MLKMDSVEDARSKVMSDIKRVLDNLRAHCANTPTSVPAGIECLRAIRNQCYEEINQIQHEDLVVKAAEYLAGFSKIPSGALVEWNPRQTGGALEPDLRVLVDGAVILSAEVTTSERPVGVIDTRMAATLKKLNAMAGDKFYFVCSEGMRARAATKVTKAGWGISVACI
jgi:hypothetical protein